MLSRVGVKVEGSWRQRETSVQPKLLLDDVQVGWVTDDLDDMRYPKGFLEVWRLPPF